MQKCLKTFENYLEYIQAIWRFKMFTEKDHCFVICAYKENPHIEETIHSLKQQTVKSKIYLSTSTPNKYLEDICTKHDIQMFVNKNPKNAGVDWNYAYDNAPTRLVTIAHQDDVYEPNFLEVTLNEIRSNEDFILCFTDYYELKKGEKEMTNTLLKIKRFMNWPLSIKKLQKSRFIRRRALSIGCAICCPAVTFNKEKAGNSIFDASYINSCDYKTWCDLAELEGEFVYIKDRLLAHRIYAESATSLNLENNIRQKEDLEIFCRYWPRWFAKKLNKLYATSEKSNKI